MFLKNENPMDIDNEMSFDQYLYVFIPQTNSIQLLSLFFEHVSHI